MSFAISLQVNFSTSLSITAEDKLEIIRQKLKDFDQRVGSRTKAIKVIDFASSQYFITIYLRQNELTTVEDAKENIAIQREEVVSNIKNINNATLEYEFNNFVTTHICDTTRNYSYSVFKRWLLFYPLLQLYMANENKVNANVYASAAVEGTDLSVGSMDDGLIRVVFRLFDAAVVAHGN